MHKIIVHLNQNKCKVIKKHKSINILTKNVSKNENIEINVENEIIQINEGKVFSQNIKIDKNVIFYNYGNKLYDIKKSIIAKKNNEKNIAKRLQPLYHAAKPLLYSKKITQKRYLVYLLTPLLFYTISCKSIINYMCYSIYFLLDEPIGIKQNKIINLYIGNFFLITLGYIKNMTSRANTSILCTYLWCISWLIVKIFSNILKMLKELIFIFQGKNYNRIKRRVDKITIGSDRVVIAVFLFAMLVLAVYNLFGYFILCYFILNVINLYIFLFDIIEFLLTVDFSLYCKKTIVKNKVVEYQRLTMFDRIMAGIVYCRCK
ncbi:hypothetical protein BDAP_001211 [Binucleata daphniae]